MKALDVRLQNVRIEEIKGVSFFSATENREEVALRAQFKASLITPLNGLGKGDNFEILLNFTAFLGAENEPLFEISLLGLFEILDDHVLKDLADQYGVYEAANFLFPYLRQLSRPIIEGLSLTDLQFPFFMPSPPRPAKKPSRKKITP